MSFTQMLVQNLENFETSGLFGIKYHSHLLMQTPKTRTRPAMQTLSNVKSRAAPARTELYVSDTSPQQTTPGVDRGRQEAEAGQAGRLSKLEGGVGRLHEFD
ncbi:unnamed protein product [Cylicocyclus nassatus]|uniref:Uncharacterized protein n=1 Tax=Cylicocyclus nassatus TaxID=53992 RepID=A0AA36M944_CYLNA|nr:unnamed protein product [Cylicocyclus nassatus]